MLEVPLSPEAQHLFQEVRDLRDGIRLVRDCFRPDMHGGLVMADYRRQHSLPRLPPPPPKGALVFPGRNPSEPLPAHAFRYLLRTMDISERPTDFSSAFLKAKDCDAWQPLNIATHPSPEAAKRIRLCAWAKAVFPQGPQRP